ncbi:hypothetical protein IB238_05460 [Rhizobium sp. ARZ01]|uniref:hypothetical protein n=1 Tax=Rhizobium sp. ARZ01 TaxID=2769313 RepID=UPI001784608F|nr:hypothetical protein [Rhizobium sp. ARZ01]MBD9372076.1 hypothetical protein [Rhizobium sp. ARZ01]
MPEQQELENLYRAIADRTPHGELLQMMYDIFGEWADLRPPVSEARLARLCNTEVTADA